MKIISNSFFIKCFFILSTNVVFAQNFNSDSTQVNYAHELKLLKEQISELKKQVDANQQKISKKTNIIDRTKISSFAVFRVTEIDWNQQLYNPETKEGYHEGTRAWARILASVYLDTKITEKLDYRFGIMLFPGFAFGANTDSRLSIFIDEIWIKYKFKPNQYIKIGRQDASEIWTNQIGTQFDFWRHDGLSYLYTNKINTFNISGKAAFFIETYRNNQSLNKQGRMYGFSGKIDTENSKRAFEFSSGLIKANALANQFVSDLQNSFWDGDLTSDYTIWASQIAYNFKTLNNLTFKVDFYQNFKNYQIGQQSNLITDVNGKNSFEAEFDKNSAPNFTNQRTGVYASVKSDVPFISPKFSISAAYLYMEKYAALDLYAQFDLARWTSTNIKGWEFTFLYKLNDRISFRNRTFFINEIKGLHGANPDFKRSGNRTRFDIIINF